MARIVVASDHAGYELKRHLVDWLASHDHSVLDLGPEGGNAVDYPDFAHRLAQSVATDSVERGVLVCGTGVGMAMSANRTPTIRAVNCTDLYTARMARAHNDANVLALGARVVGVGLAEELVRVFLETPFDGGRHAQRVAKIEHDPVVGRTVEKTVGRT